MLVNFLHNLSPSFVWSTSWPGTLHFIRHTFLHPTIVFFLWVCKIIRIDLPCSCHQWCSWTLAMMTGSWHEILQQLQRVKARALLPTTKPHNTYEANKTLCGTQIVIFTSKLINFLSCASYQSYQSSNHKWHKKLAILVQKLFFKSHLCNTNHGTLSTHK